MNIFLKSFALIVLPLLLASLPAISFGQEAKARELVNYAGTLEMNNQPDSAIFYCNKAIALYPNISRAYLVRGRSYSDKKNRYLAIVDYNKAIELDPRNDSAFNTRGYANYVNGDHSKAISDFNKAIELNPKFIFPYFNRGNAYYAIDSNAKAISDYSKAIELNPKHAYAFYERGLTYHKIGKDSLALDDYNRAIELSPKFSNAYTSRGLLYYEKGNSGKAFSDYDKAIESDPKIAVAYNDRGLIYKSEGNYEKALQDYKACLAIEPLQKYALLNILPCLIRMGRFEEAADYYAKYKSNNLNGYIESNDWGYYKFYLIAATEYVRNGLYKDAQDQLRSAEARYNSYTAVTTGINADAKSSYSDVLALKGYISEKLKLNGDASAAYNQALVINPNQPDVKEGLNRLRNLGGTVKNTEPAINKPSRTLDLPSLSNDPKYHAILIAEQNYSDPSIPVLQKPIADALKLKRLLETKYTFPASNIDTLFNRSREDLLGAIIQKCNTLNGDDNLLIFYSGHGTAEKDQFGNIKGYLVPCSAKKENLFTYISFNDIVTALGRGNTKHILFIADACFSGALTKEIPKDAPKDVRLAYESLSRKVMSSGNLEPVPDNSIFMYYLLKRLEENNQKYLTADELFHSFKIAVSNNSNNLPQYEAIKDTGDEGGDFVFIKK